MKDLKYKQYSLLPTPIATTVNSKLKKLLASYEDHATELS